MAELRSLLIAGRRIHVAGLSFLAVVLAALSGCGETACFQWSQRDYDDLNGACPGQAEAKPYMTQQDPFGSNQCGSILTVDSEGDFDGTTCCYDVTKTENNQFCN